MGKKSLFLLEYEGQVKSCSRRLREIEGQKQIIAVSPFAAYELDKQNIPYRIPEDYYDADELYTLGMENIQKVEDLCRAIDKQIHLACPTVAELDIRPAFYNFYELKIIYDSVMIRRFQLSKIIEAEKPDRIFSYEPPSQPTGFSVSSVTFPGRESLYALLLALPGWEVPIELLPLVEQADSDSQPGKNQHVERKIKQRLNRWMETHPLHYDIISAIMGRRWRKLGLALKDGLLTGKKSPVLLLSPVYDWDSCGHELRAAGINPVLRLTTDLTRWLAGTPADQGVYQALSTAWQGLRTDSEFRKFFRSSGFDFFGVVESRLRFLVERLTSVCLESYKEVKGILEKKRVRAVLSSSLSSCPAFSVAQAAHNARIPVINWQHGGYGFFPQPMAIYFDMLNADFSFLFGEGMCQKYSEQARNYRTKLIPVGSASLEALSDENAVTPTRLRRYLRLDPRKKAILYALTAFYGNNLYVSFPPAFSDNNYWRTQKATLSVLEQYDSYVTVVKTHPNPIYRETPLRLYATENGFRNCRFIRSECSFTDLLPLADIIVIDFPSTTLLQALTTSKPVFVYTRHLHLLEEAQRLLKQRAFCSGNLETFLDTLRKFIAGDSSSINVDLNNKEFLRRYGTHTGMCATKAAKKVSEIIQNYNKV